MRKLCILARLMVDSGGWHTLDEASQFARQVYESTVPADQPFEEWNREVPDAWVEEWVRHQPRYGRFDWGTVFLSSWPHE